jgi:hypothetical protein
MENLYSFNNFLDIAKSDKVKENKTVFNYLNNKLSFEDFEKEFESQTILLNEGLNDWYKKVLDWALGIFKSIINSPEAYYLKEGGKKVFNVLKKVFDFIKKFKEKHPVIFKCIVIFLIIIMLLVVTAATTYAATTGDPEYSKLVINTAIGFIDSIHNDPTNIKFTDFDLMEAKAYLITLRDGGDATKYAFSETAIKLSKTALEIMNNSITEYKVTHNDNLAVSLVQWFETGSKMIILKLEQFGTAGGMHKAIEIGTSGPIPTP